MYTFLLSAVTPVSAPLNSITVTAVLPHASQYDLCWVVAETFHAVFGMQLKLRQLWFLYSLKHVFVVQIPNGSGNIEEINLLMSPVLLLPERISGLACIRFFQRQ